MNKIETACTLVCLGALILSAGSASGQATEAANKGPVSGSASAPVSSSARYRLERQLQDLDDRRETVTSDSDLVTRLQGAVARAEEAIKDVDVDAQYEKKIAALQASFKALLEEKPDSALSADYGVLATFLENANAVAEPLDRLLREVPEIVYQPLNSYSYDSREAITFRGVIEPRSNDIYNAPELFSGWFKSFRNLEYSRISGGREPRRSDFEGTIKGIQKDVDEYTIEKLRKDVNEAKTLLQAYLGDIRSALAEEKSRLENELANIDREIETVGKQLDESVQAQSAIDKNLTYAIWMMMGVLVVLFLSLRIFPSEIAKDLISKRSLVEVISMAFMLLTIIILGTGGRIGSETLGTLLGMIAGYIFGRRIVPQTAEVVQAPLVAQMPVTKVES